MSLVATMAGTGAQSRRTGAGRDAGATQLRGGAAQNLLRRAHGLRDGMRKRRNCAGARSRRAAWPRGVAASASRRPPRKDLWLNFTFISMRGRAPLSRSLGWSGAAGLCQCGGRSLARTRGGARLAAGRLAGRAVRPRRPSALPTHPLIRPRWPTRSWHGRPSAAWRCTRRCQSAARSGAST